MIEDFICNSLCCKQFSSVKVEDQRFCCHSFYCETVDLRLSKLFHCSCILVRHYRKKIVEAFMVLHCRAIPSDLSLTFWVLEEPSKTCSPVWIRTTIFLLNWGSMLTLMRCVQSNVHRLLCSCRCSRNDECRIEVQLIVWPTLSLIILHPSLVVAEFLLGIIHLDGLANKSGHSVVD